MTKDLSITHMGQDVKLTLRKDQPYETVRAYNGDNGNIYLLPPSSEETPEPTPEHVYVAGTVEHDQYAREHGDK